MHRLGRLGLAHPRLAALSGGLVVAVVSGLLYVNLAVAQQPQGVARGATVYLNNCQVCHGINAQGHYGPQLIPAPPEITQAPRPALVQGLTQLVRGGIPGAMPGFRPEQVSDDDMAALVDYLLDLQAKAPPGRRFNAALEPVGPVPNTADRLYIAVTRHTLSGAFKTFWERNGGARLFGYPISEEYLGYDENGAAVTMQLFERARFEYRPQAGPGDDVTLGRLGAEDADLRTYWARREGGPGGP